jgi:hypothetical protein
MPTNSTSGTTEDAFTQATQYLARVVPWPNAGEPPAFINICNTFIPSSGKVKTDAKGKPIYPWGGRAARPLDEAIGYINFSLNKQTDTRDIYVCLSTQREPGEAKTASNGYTYYKANRGQANAVALKSLFLDIDTNVTKQDEKGYEDFQTAQAALLGFIKTTGLPPPNVIVSSGGGIHVCWVMSRALTVDEWKPLALALAEAAKQHGLKCDSACTIDAARVLRVPNTFNRKLDPPLPVKLIRFHPNDFSPEAMGEKLAPYKVALPASTAAIEDPSLFPPRQTVTDELGAGVEQPNFPAPKLDDLAAECPFVREAIDTGGGSYANPLWNLTTLLATFTEGGRADARRMANKHPGYSKESTDALFDRKEREKAEKGIGWPSCKAISGSGCTPCQACPHFAAGKSPLHFALPSKVTAAAPEAVDYVPGNEAACRQALDRVVSDDPNTFRIGSLLVILRIPSQAELPPNTVWSADFPGTTPATPPDVMERAERLTWRQPAGGKGGARLVSTHPPRNFVNDYLVQMRDRYGARPLVGIACTPVIAPSGGVRFPKGYDPETGLFHHRTPLFELPDNPSRADAVASAQILFEPFFEYKLSGLVHLGITRPRLIG